MNLLDNVCKFLGPQIDYVWFLEATGLAVFVYAAVVGHREDSGRSRWNLLALFAAFYILGIWARIIAGCTPWFTVIESARTIATLASLVLLVEFARRRIVDSRGKGPGVWLTIAALALVVLFGHSSWKLLEMRARLALGLPAGLCVALMMLGQARQLEKPRRWPLICLGISILLLCVAEVIGNGPTDTIPTRSPAIDYGWILTILNECLKAALALCAGWSALYFGHNSKTRKRAGDAGKQGFVKWVSLGLPPVLLAGAVLTSLIGGAVNQHLNNQFLVRTWLAASKLSPSDVGHLTGSPSDIKTPAYKRIVRQLVETHTINNDAKYVYLMRQRGDKMIFIADAEPPTSEDFSPPGEVYEETEADDLVHYKTQAALVMPPFRDAWGIWITSQVPIIDVDKGRMVACLSMDIDAHLWESWLAQYRLLCIVITGLLCLLIFATSSFVQARQEAQIAAFERRYHILEQVSPVGIFTADPRGNCTHVNERWSEIAGLGEQEALGTGWTRTLHPDDTETCYPPGTRRAANICRSRWNTGSETRKMKRPG